MNQTDKRKRLRGYLKGFRDCQSQAKEIEKMLAGGGVLESVREPLLKAKEDFERHCQNVQLILGYTKGGLERRILNALYIFGKSLRQVAKETRYSQGYCSNVESKAINRMSEVCSVMLLVDESSDNS